MMFEGIIIGIEKAGRGYLFIHLSPVGAQYNGIDGAGDASLEVSIEITELRRFMKIIYAIQKV